MTVRTDSDQVVSFRELARRLNVSEKAVRNAVKSRRLVESVSSRAGRQVIVDVDLAIAEWQKNAPPKAVIRAARVRTNDAESAAAAKSADGSAIVDPIADSSYLRVWRDDEDDDRVLLMALMGDDVDSEDARDWFALGLTRRVAAELGLHLWIRAGGHLEDLPGMIRHRQRHELANALRAAADRVERG